MQNAACAYSPRLQHPTPKTKPFVQHSRHYCNTRNPTNLFVQRGIFLRQRFLARSSALVVLLLALLEQSCLVLLHGHIGVGVEGTRAQRHIEKEVGSNVQPGRGKRKTKTGRNGRQKMYMYMRMYTHMHSTRACLVPQDLLRGNSPSLASSLHHTRLVGNRPTTE